MMQRFDIAFGKVTYEAGAPKNAPRWMWQCRCAECHGNGALHGPFKTLREAERDAMELVTLVASEDGTQH